MQLCKSFDVSLVSQPTKNESEVTERQYSGFSFWKPFQQVWRCD